MTRISASKRAGVRMMVAVAVILATNAWAEQVSPITISGRVVDGAGQPLAGAVVTCYVNTYSEAIRDYAGIKLGETITQADGAYSFEAAGESPSYRFGFVVAQKAGYALTYATWPMQSDQQTDITLGAPKTLAGVVVDEDGTPVPQATVAISVLMAGVGPDNLGLARTVGPQVLVVTSDAEGRFAFRNLPAGATAEFVVKKAGRASIDTFDRQAGRSAGYKYAVGQADIELVQHAAARIEGVVVDRDTGQPVAGIPLRVMEGGATPLATHDLITSAQDGTFRIDALPPGNHVIRLMAPLPREGMAKWVAEPLSVAVEAGQTIADGRIEVSKGGVLEVLVTDATANKPIPGVTVSLRHPVQETWASGVSDASGLARVRLVPGTYLLQNVAAPSYSTESRQQIVTVVEGRTQRIDVTLQARPKTAGVIRDAHGQPVAGATVQVMPGGSRGEAVSDTRGKYEVTWDPSFWGERGTTFCLLVRHTE
ncbi:MAG: carboxypeptidase regulatory-like domain-containing protein [Sedimentisphaerales bacterium]|nr:carboxypeptidase regulatory-like domain-containing protein [Sedimentisphaerales bacterium]